MRNRLTLFFILITISSLQAQEDKKITILKNRMKASSDDSLTYILLDLSREYYHINRDSSIKYDNLALVHATKTDDRKGEARAKINIALSKINEGKSEEAERLLTESVKVATKFADTPALLKAYSNLGILNHYNADYNIAVEYYLKAAEFADQLQNEKEKIRLYYNIADVFNQNKIYDKSHEYYRAVIHEGKVEYPMLYALANMQLSQYYSESNLDSSDYYLENSLEVLSEIQSPQFLLELYSGQAGALIRKEQYDLAYESYQKALAYAIQIDQDYYLAACYCNLGEIEMLRKNYQQGAAYFETYQRYQSQSENDYLAVRCLEMWSNLEAAKGDYEQSLTLLQRKNMISDSLYSIENRNLISELEIKYESAKKEAEIQKQNLELERKTSQRNLLMTGMGLSTMLGLTFIWGILSRSKRNRQIAYQKQHLQTQKIAALEQEKKLLSMSSLLEGQETERIRIAKDLHDGLGGLLTTVKAHFGKIQSEIQELENLNIYQKATGMIDKAHDEVRRISHNLMPSDLRAGGLSLALSQIAQELEKTHGKKVELECLGLQKDRLNENVEIAIYRVIQELTNNIIKHARAEKIFIQITKRQEEVVLVVEDNGIGFEVKDAGQKDGLGIHSVLSRIEQIGGKVDIYSKKGSGTTYTINVPL